jgi:hypothetical protein
MVASYLDAKLSGRGASPQTIELRRRSCFGDPDAGISACSMVRGHAPKRYCGACGCGARREAILDEHPETGHSKLEFVRLTCPLKRPGFSNSEVTDARTG